jgi:carboxylate-amine ligase
MLTLGVEEEYLLVDPSTCEPVPRAEEVLAAADLRPALRPSEAQHELLQVQVEVATPVCEDLDAVSRHLARMRAALQGAAAQHGCRILPVGAAPFGAGEPVPVTREERYRAAHRQAPLLVGDLMLNGMHVHVGVPDEEERVAALSRIRPWLPVLVAVAANSPIWQGEDSRFASWRTVTFDRWAVGGPPPAFRDAADHRARVDALLRAGAITDRGQLYWQTRLSDSYPTVEVRAADVQLTVADARCVAGLVRALVAAAVLAERRGLPREEPPDELLRAATWHAARTGLAGPLILPSDGTSRSAADAVAALLEFAGPGLAATGDGPDVQDGLKRFGADGNGAVRQRAWYAEAGRDGLARGLLASALAG